MYQIRYAVNVDFVPDGAGPMSVTAAQTLQMSSAPTGPGNTNPPIAIAGGSSLTSGNLSSAITAMATQVNTQFQAVLARLQAFASAGG